jgi:hypothetical protein
VEQLAGNLQVSTLGVRSSVLRHYSSTKLALLLALQHLRNAPGFADGLLDELTLMVFPVVVGRGKRLFEDGGDWKGLKLVGPRTFATGVVSLVYRPADEG